MNPLILAVVIAAFFVNASFQEDDLYEENSEESSAENIKIDGVDTSNMKMKPLGKSQIDFSFFEKEPFDADKIKVETIHMPSDCDQKVATNDSVILHVTAKWTDGPVVLDTRIRNVPLEIPASDTMNTPAVDHALIGSCVGQRLKIQLKKLGGYLESKLEHSDKYDQIEYDVEILSTSPKSTGALFYYIDTNGDNFVDKDEYLDFAEKHLLAVYQLFDINFVREMANIVYPTRDRNSDGKLSFEEFMDDSDNKTAGKQTKTSGSSAKSASETSGSSEKSASETSGQSKDEL